MLKNGLKLIAFFALSFTAMANISKAEDSKNVAFTKVFINKVLDITSSGKPMEYIEQKVSDDFTSTLDFEVQSKMALGVKYKQLTDEEKKDFVYEYGTFLAYSWLPKIANLNRNNSRVLIANKVEKLSASDENVNVSFVLPNSSSVDLNIRVRCKQDKPCKFVNLVLEGIDLANMYNTQFNTYIEKHNGQVNSVIKYLRDENAKFKKPSKLRTKVERMK